MKWEKHSLFAEEVPQTKWEADYLIEERKRNNVVLALIVFEVVIILLSFAWVVNSLITQTCEFQFEGKALGNASAELKNSDLKELNITSLEGKGKVKMPCFWISKLNGN